MLLASISSILFQDVCSTSDVSDDDDDDEVFEPSCQSTLPPSLRVIGSKVPSSAVSSSLKSSSSSFNNYSSASSQSGSEEKGPEKKFAIKSTTEWTVTDDVLEDLKQALVIPVKTGKGSVIHKVIKNPAKYKTEMCEPYKKGLCTFGTDCQFAHGIRELRPVKLHNKYKTVKCRNYESKRFCEHGNNCAFIHDDNSKAEKMLASEMLKLSRAADKEIKFWMAKSIAQNS